MRARMRVANQHGTARMPRKNAAVTSVLEVSSNPRASRTPPSGMEMPAMSSRPRQVASKTPPSRAAATPTTRQIARPAGRSGSITLATSRREVAHALERSRRGGARTLASNRRGGAKTLASSRRAPSQALASRRRGGASNVASWRKGQATTWPSRIATSRSQARMPFSHAARPFTAPILGAQARPWRIRQPRPPHVQHKSGPRLTWPS